LLEQAQLGKKVVRLKGGDPFIFGRGGEEALFLAEHNIPFDVVPGVNAADGCAAYQGIPLTHRGIANRVQFLTGHKQKGQDMQLDWSGLVDPEMTLVIFMGLANLAHIAAQLIEHGMDKHIPVAAIQHGTTEHERVHFGSISTIAAELDQQGFEAPTTIIVGRVVSLAEKIK